MISPAELDAAIVRHEPLQRTSEPPASTAEAYAIQRAFVAKRSARTGEAIAGYKVAFTSRESQAAVATGGYHSGILLDSQILTSGANVRLDERFTPILEVELAFRIVEPFDGDTPLHEVVRRTEIGAAIEMPESRFANWFGGEYPALSVTEAVSDDCLAGLVITGERWTPTADVDLSSVGATLHHDGELVRQGSIALVVPSPIVVLSWLAGQLAERGDAFREGQIVSSGTWTDTIPATPGKYVATFEAGIGDVSIEVE